MSMWRILTDTLEIIQRSLLVYFLLSQELSPSQSSQWFQLTVESWLFIVKPPAGSRSLRSSLWTITATTSLPMSREHVKKPAAVTLWHEEQLSRIQPTGLFLSNIFYYYPTRGISVPFLKLNCHSFYRTWPRRLCFLSHMFEFYLASCWHGSNEVHHPNQIIIIII